MLFYSRNAYMTPIYLGQRSDAGHSHVTHTKKAGGYSDEVWSRSLKPRLSYGQLCHFTVKMDI